MASRVYYVVGLPASERSAAVPYGYSTNVDHARAALERARARGIRWADVWTKASPVRTMRDNQWLPPFDARRAGFDR